jgi:cation diffusion facilitator CzcD-associated flavoprotein CzcO
VQDPVLREELTPRYVMGCKRIPLSNDYDQALIRPNVEVVTEGIARVTGDGVVTGDGGERRVDAIVCGTGFAVADGMLSLDLTGLHGKNLRDGRNISRWPGSTIACGWRTRRLRVADYERIPPTR